MMKRKMNNIRFMSLLKAVFATITVFILLLGLLSINYTKVIVGKTKILYDRPHTNLVNMWNVKAKISETGSLLKDGIITKSAPSDISENVTEISELFNQIEANKVDPKAPRSEGMSAVLDAFAVWTEEGNKVIDSLKKTSSVSEEEIKLYSTAEADFLNKMNMIIETATENGLKFRNSTVTMANQAMLVMIFIFLVVLIYIMAFIRILMNRFNHPMKLVLDAAENMAAGNLNMEIDYDNTDEFGELIASFNKMKNYLFSIVEDIDIVLEKVGQGDFNLVTKVAYVGDFIPILNSLHKITDNLTVTLKEINDASEKVFEGASQMSNGAQVLSEGAANEANSIQELASAIDRISAQISNNSQNAGDANQKVITISNEIIGSNEQMKEMMKAMENISDKSREIANIIHVIEDIADQTNLLSLNASIEAARAGEHGKGFAVVANEVKALAEQSSAAARDTAELITGSLSAVDKGTEIASHTAENLLIFAEGAKEIITSVEKITRASEEQAQGVNQISRGVEQVSNVIQDTSSTAEETAAASEKLAAQAEVLKSLVNNFQLKEFKKAE